MIKYLNINLDTIIISFVVTLLVILIYDLLKNKGKLHIHINKLKVNILNKDDWKNTSNKISDNTKGIDIEIQFELYNHKKNFNSIRNIKAVIKNKFKYIKITNYNLNLIDTVKTVSGSTTYEKLKYVNMLPNEVKIINVMLKLEPEEMQNLKKNPLYISYKEGLRTKKIKLNKYLRRK